MATPFLVPRRVIFGAFELRIDTGELLKHGLRVRLQRQPFRILAALLARPGELVTREQLREQLWKDGTFVEFEHGLNAAINRLREALADDADNPRFIETLPRLGYRFIAQVTSPRASRMAVVAEAAIPSIAVLPFTNLSADAANEYFSDGLAEDIINALVKIPGLKVIARTSAFAFKGQNVDICRIAETLGVANVLEGSVRRSGDRIRVTAQLVAAADGSHLWSERYDRELADVFAVQDEISAAITGALKTRLSPQPVAQSRYIPKLNAHEALLKARYCQWKMTPDYMNQAKELFEQAIALDPRYALAHAEYAAHVFGRSITGMTPMHETMPIVRATAHQALELDPSLPEAHASLGMAAAVYDYDWKEAARRFTLATASDAVSPWVHAVFGGFYFLGAGRWKEALEQAERAVQGDPLDLLSRCAIGVSLGAVGHYAEAEAHLRQALDLDSNSFMALGYLAALYAGQNRFVEAFPFAQRGYVLAPWSPALIGEYAALLMVTGEQEQGKALIGKLGSGQAYKAPLGLAVFHTFCGEIDLAADWFEKAIKQRIPLIGIWLQGANSEALRASPRWPKLATLMNLPGTRL